MEQSSKCWRRVQSSALNNLEPRAERERVFVVSRSNKIYGRDFLCWLLGAFNLCDFMTQRKTFSCEGLYGTYIYCIRATHESMCQGAAVSNHGTMAKAQAAKSAVYLRACV